MCGVVGEWYFPESCFLSNTFDDWGCEVFNVDVVMVVYCDSTVVGVKDADASCICKWFDSNRGVVEGRNNISLHRAGWKVAGGSILV